MSTATPPRPAAVRRRALRAAACAAIALTLAACDSGRRITGMVTAGPASIPTVVAADDERLLGQGIANVEIKVLSKGTVVHRATSEPDGTFEFKAAGPARTNAVDIQATGDGILPVRGSLHLPREGQRLLIIAKPKTGTDAGG